MRDKSVALRDMRFLMLNWRDPKNPLAGGAERVTEGYWRGLLERGHEVFWFAFAFEGCEPEEDLKGIRVIRRGGKGTAIFAAWIWYRRAGRFDLVVDQIHGIPWYAPWWSGTNTIAYLHEVLGPIWRCFYRRHTAWIGQLQERLHLRLYRRVPFWTSAESTARMLREFGVRHVVRIPYGVEVEALPYLPSKPLVLPLRLIVVSRLAPNKRVDHAIRLMAVLREKGVEATLKIVGDGVDAPKLRALVKELQLEDRVSFLGHLAESTKLELLRDSHFLIHTSIREGWGLNVIEANAMGTPAIAYPTPGLTESTLHDVTGIIAHCEEPEAVADALCWILDRPGRYEIYRRNAWERAKQFHWKRVLPVACDRLEAFAKGVIPESVDFHFGWYDSSSTDQKIG